MSGNEDAVALKRRSILLGAPALAGGLALAGPSRAGLIRLFVPAPTGLAPRLVHAWPR